MKALSNINKFVQLPFREKVWMGEALFHLIWYSVLIHMLPFRWWEGRIGQKMQPLNEEGLMLEQQDKIRKIRGSVLRSNKVIGGLGKCFALSLTIRHMLQKQEIDSTLHIGLRKEASSQLLAHAWISYGKLIIYGGKTAPLNFTQILIYNK